MRLSALHSLQLRSRLAIASALTIVVTLAITSVVLYSLNKQAAISDVDRQLQQQAQAFDRPPPLRRQGEGQRGSLPLRLARRELLAQVVASDGSIAQSSRPLAELGELPVDASTIAIAKGEQDGARFRTIELDGEQLRMFESRSGRTAVQLAIPIGFVQSQLDRLRRLLIGMLLVAAAISIVIGRWLAGQALQPVFEIAREAREIARTADLARRVPLPERDDELTMLSRTINEMLSSIDRLHDSQRQFVADASHELRTPITSLQGNLEYLQRPDTSAAESQAAWADVFEDIDRLSALAASLLDLARLDAHGAVEHEPVKIGKLVEQIVTSQARRTDSHTVAVEVDPNVVVTGNARALEQLVANLVSNAVQYTPDGSHVNVTAKPARVDNQDFVVVQVADDGPGMSHEDAVRAFDRFHRALSSTNIDGSGLGLSIARSIARAHGGDIVLATSEGNGCTFDVNLPAA